MRDKVTGFDFRAMAIRFTHAALRFEIFRDELAAALQAGRLSPRSRLSFRRRRVRLDAWRRRRLAQAALRPLAPVGHLVKPSAARPGRRAHRRSRR